MSGTATVEELREALQFALAELREAEDKFFVSHCNHPADYGIKNPDSLFAIHRREDKTRLAIWADRMKNAAESVRKVLAK